MLEYVFFTAAVRDKFLAFLADLGVDCEAADGETLIVSLSEDLDEDLAERIEDRYDELLDEQAAEVDAAEPDTIHRVGIQFSRADGSVGMARLDPDLVNRIRREFTVEEMQALVQTVADAVEDTSGRRLCQN